MKSLTVEPNVVVIAKPRADIRNRGGATRTLIDLVHAEYEEMPGLSLTLLQAQRLWTADRATCEEVFRRLISAGVLKETTKGRFVRV